MELKVRREILNEKETIGKLYINNVFFSYTLEPTNRGLLSDMTEDQIRGKKIYGITAIPKGKYHLILTYSKKFKMILPELLHVKGFFGVRIHGGNTFNDTQGCILVGKYAGGHNITESQNTLKRLVSIMQGAINADEGVIIIIE